MPDKLYAFTAGTKSASAQTRGGPAQTNSEEETQLIFSEYALENMFTHTASHRV